MWKILKEIGIPDNFTCLLRNLYAGQEATVRTRHGATDWFQTGKEYVKAVYCHPRVGVLQFPFCHLAWSCLTILQWGGWSFGANTRSEVTMSHSVPVFLSWDISLRKIFAQLSALCPQPGEEGLQMFAELGADSLWGESADQSKALLDGVFHVPSPRLGIFLVLWRQTRISIRNTSSPNLWLYHYSALPAFTSRTGLQVPASCSWVNGGDCSWVTWALYLVLPAYCYMGNHLCFLERVFLVDIRPMHQALQATQTAVVKK